MGLIGGKNWCVQHGQHCERDCPNPERAFTTLDVQASWCIYSAAMSCTADLSTAPDMQASHSSGIRPKGGHGA